MQAATTDTRFQKCLSAAQEWATRAELAEAHRDVLQKQMNAVESLLMALAMGNKKVVTYQELLTTLEVR